MMSGETWRRTNESGVCENGFPQTLIHCACYLQMRMSICRILRDITFLFAQSKPAKVLTHTF